MLTVQVPSLRVGQLFCQILHSYSKQRHFQGFSMELLFLFSLGQKDAFVTLELF